MTISTESEITFIPDTHGVAFVLWDAEYPTIYWTEALSFHNRYLEGALIMDEGLPQAVETWLEERLSGIYNVAVCWSELDDDGEALEISIYPVAPMSPDTPLSVAYGALWPAIATLFNVTDPGTYNSPYMFAHLPKQES